MPACCHACLAMQHLIVITNINALRFKLTGDLGHHSHAHTAVHDAVEQYNNSGGHTCDFLNTDPKLNTRRVDGTKKNA